MKLNTDPHEMLRAAHKVAVDYSNDKNILGVLARHPMPDDPDFPQTCDVELAVVTQEGVDAWSHGYGLVRRIVDDVFIDVCAVNVGMFRSNIVKPTEWLLSLGDPRTYEVLCDFDSGKLSGIFSEFKAHYVTSASSRLPSWLEEVRRHLLVALDTRLEKPGRFSEAAFALAYLISALLDLSGKTFAGTFLKLPRRLTGVSVELAEKFSEYFPAQERDPYEAARQISILAYELAPVYPKLTSLNPQDRGVMEYNLNPTEVMYRTFVIEEIAKKDRTTALWYARAWASFLLFSHAVAVTRTVDRYVCPAKPYAIWENILGNPDAPSVELFIGWVDELFKSTSNSTHSVKRNNETTQRNGEQVVSQV